MKRKSEKRLKELIAEQFIGQQLLYRNGGSAAPSLHYWLRDGGKNNAEVDYVIADGMKVLPDGATYLLEMLPLYAAVCVK